MIKNYVKKMAFSLPMRKIIVAAAIIRRDGKVMIAKRKAEGKPMDGKWEFPGGKIDSIDGEVDNDEKKYRCIVREMKEEFPDLQVRMEPKPYATSTYHEPNLEIKLHAFLGTYTGGMETAKEHDEVLYVARHELFNYEWANPDIPIVEKLYEEWDQCLNN
jgi:8-oxo-dGTP diphosphatase